MAQTNIRELCTLCDYGPEGHMTYDGRCLFVPGGFYDNSSYSFDEIMIVMRARAKYPEILKHRADSFYIDLYDANPYWQREKAAAKRLT